MTRLNCSRHKTRTRAALGGAACLSLACGTAAWAEPAAGPILAFAPDSETTPTTTAESATAPDAPPAKPKRPIDFTLFGFYEYQFETNMDGGGDFGVQRLGGNLNARKSLTDDLRLSVNFGYELDVYDFNGATTFEQTEITILQTDPDNLNPDGTLLSSISVEAAPWGDIQTYDLNATFILDLSNNWSVFLGPVFQLSREDGADWGNSLVGGGVFGTTVQFSDSLTIGGGLGIISQIEDDIRFFPLFTLHWQFTEHLALSTQTPSAIGKTFALELIWTPNTKIDIAMGGGYERKRFRLDDDGLAPDGVGEATRIPLWIRASYNFSSKVSVDLFGAISTKITLKVDDNSGDKVADDDGDIAPSLGARLNIRF